MFTLCKGYLMDTFNDNLMVWPIKTGVVILKAEPKYKYLLRIFMVYLII